MNDLYSKLVEINSNFNMTYDYEMRNNSINKLHDIVSRSLKELHEDDKWALYLEKSDTSMEFESFFDKNYSKFSNTTTIPVNDKASCINYNKLVVACFMLTANAGLSLSSLTQSLIVDVTADPDKYFDAAVIDDVDKDYYRELFGGTTNKYYHEYVKERDFAVTGGKGTALTKSTANSGLGDVAVDGETKSPNNGNATWYILLAMSLFMTFITGIIVLIGRNS